MTDDEVEVPRMEEGEEFGISLSWIATSPRLLAMTEGILVV